jgi:hypothetical protein
MFDPLICGQMRQADLAYVSGAALVALKKWHSLSRNKSGRLLFVTSHSEGMNILRSLHNAIEICGLTGPNARR